MTGRLRSKVLVVAAVAASLVPLAACGGQVGSPSLLTWLDKADLVCRNARTEADAARSSTGASASADALQASAARSRREARALRDIGTPREQATDTSALVTALEGQATALEALAEAQRADSVAAEGPLALEVVTANQQVTAAAAALGLRACTAEASATTTTVPGAAPGSVPPAAEPGLGDGTEDGGTTQEY